MLNLLQIGDFKKLCFGKVMETCVIYYIYSLVSWSRMIRMPI